MMVNMSDANDEPLPVLLASQLAIRDLLVFDKVEGKFGPGSATVELRLTKGADTMPVTFSTHELETAWRNDDITRYVTSRVLALVLQAAQDNAAAVAPAAWTGTADDFEAYLQATEPSPDRESLTIVRLAARAARQREHLAAMVAVIERAGGYMRAEDQAAYRAAREELGT